ncbi:hypothetical protein PR048_014240 [Dryococelus australis]|uniref:Uncharacterized protein n=1 Tax=Dryococelus australis TaxID=614101 RepID=A0ABQ9HDM8_9NEOP|nr:hypothetical protein PR048_014240 [Dryococelus australis]
MGRRHLCYKQFSIILEEVNFDYLPGLNDWKFLLDKDLLLSLSFILPRKYIGLAEKYPQDKSASVAVSEVQTWRKK